MPHDRTPEGGLHPIEEDSSVHPNETEEAPEESTQDKEEEPAEPTKPDSSEDTGETIPETETESVSFDSEKASFEKLYAALKLYRSEGWTLAKIEAQSDKARPLIEGFRDVLERGGVADRNHQDKLLSYIVDTARQAKSEHNFWEDVSRRKNMPQGSTAAEVYDMMVAGLNATEEKAEAA